MRAVLLAAGLGSRFKGAFPKPLKRLYGQQTVLGHLVNVLRTLGLDITIVIGHKADYFLPLFGEVATFVYNCDYAKHEWMTSVKIAAELIAEKSFLLGCADALVTKTSLHQLIDTPDSVLLVPDAAAHDWFRIRVADGKMGESEQARKSPGAWPDLAWGSWGHVGPLARSNLFNLSPEVLHRDFPARFFRGCQVIYGGGYNVNTLEDLEVARKAFSGGPISDKGES